MSPTILSNYTLLKIHGADAAEFLQGQLSNDVTQLREAGGRSSQTWQLTGYCNPKGRLLGLFYLWSADDEYYAITDSSLSAQNTKRLQMYVMRSKVTIEPVERATIIGAPNLESLKSFGLSIGPDGSTPDNNKSVTQFTDGWILGFGKRAMMVSIASTDDNLSATNKDAEEYDWIKAEIEDGLPSVSSNTYETFIPQMVNLDLLDGVNFKKGCYTGQEIVARMHYLGNLKQRMFICDLNHRDKTSLDLNVGDKVFTSDQSKKSAGQIVSFSEDVALAVLRLDQATESLELDNGITVFPRPGQFT